MLTDPQEAEPEDVSKFQAFIRSAARAAGMRPDRSWPAPEGGQQAPRVVPPVLDRRVAVV